MWFVRGGAALDMGSVSMTTVPFSPARGSRRWKMYSPDGSFSSTACGLQHKTAFTLIEVLVVVAIIALPIAVMVPSLTKARESARLAVCGSSLRQIGTGIAAHASAQGVIRFGPVVQEIPPSLEPNNGSLATSRVWTGP
jgi:prepilin-type N-terminal cleavage/methylation domain-containing protein